jgi:hypothetical protein
MKQSFSLGSSRRRSLFKGQNVLPAMGGDIVAAKAFSRKQAVFNEKAQQYARQGVITTPGFLRLESLAPTTATSVFNFNTLDTSGVKTSTERRLKLADTFTITDISFYLGTMTCAVANAPDASEYAKQELNTWPNPQVTAIGTRSDELESIYNGYLSLRIDTTTFIDSIPMRQFYRVGTSQKGVLGGTGGTAVQANEWPLSMYGKTELLPTIELNGQANIEWSINLPTAQICSAPATTSFVNMVLVLQGFLNQGAATVQRSIQRKLR